MVLRQSHFREAAGGGPLHAMVPWDDGLNGREAFLNPGHSPPFEGPGAGFRLIRHKKGAYRFIERVADKDGAAWRGEGWPCKQRAAARRAIAPQHHDPA